jgi:hypothetical protein
MKNLLHFIYVLESSKSSYPFGLSASLSLTRLPSLRPLCVLMLLRNYCYKVFYSLQQLHHLFSSEFLGSSRSGEWRKLHIEELNDLYTLPNIVRGVKSRRMRWVGMWRVWGRGEVCTGEAWGSLRERDHWEDPDVDGRIILRGIFRKWEGIVGTGWSGLRIGTGGGHL